MPNITKIKLDTTSYDVKDLKNVEIFNNITDLKNSDLKIGYKAKIKGTNSLYEIIENQNITIDKYYYIELNNGLIAHQLIEENIIYPELYDNPDEIEALKEVINFTCELINSKKENYEIILNKIYDFTNKFINLKKYVTSNTLTINGNNVGGFKKDDAEYLFIKDSNIDYITDLTFKNVCFYGNKTKSIIFNSPDFINITINECLFNNWGVITSTENSTNKYIQNINLINSTIRGGFFDLFIFSGCYQLNIKGNTIEHRTNSYVINQINDDTTYNKCFKLNMINNLIEGFYENSGICNLYRIENIIINNNYFESMPNTIKLESHLNYGTLEINGNRLHETRDYENAGLLNISPYNNQFNMLPNINISNNTINNTYGIYFNTTSLKSSQNINKTILFNNNDVYNGINSQYSINGNKTHSPFNVIPFIINETNGINKHTRDIVINSNDTIKYSFNKTNNEIEYTITYILQGGSFTALSMSTQNIIAQRKSYEIFYDIDIYYDDILTSSVLTSSISILNNFRYGSPNNKIQLTSLYNSNNSASNNLIVSNAQIIGNRG